MSKEKKMSLKDLDQVVGGTAITGTKNNDTIVIIGNDNMVIDGGDGNDFIKSGDGDDILVGGQGNDVLVGGAGADILMGGEGSDYMDGGYRDNADDTASGGAGDDVFVWGVTGDGNDTFNGGEGTDILGLDFDTLEADNVKDAYENGNFTIALTNADGNSVEITEGMWDANGNLVLPDDVSGVITGPEGNTMTFENVESIAMYNTDSFNLMLGGNAAELIVGADRNSNYIDAGAGGDIIVGGESDDHIDGGNDGDLIYGGGGNDYITGGSGDNADDLAFGGQGNDIFAWGISGDGNDVFHGGEGNDSLKLGLENDDSIQEAYNNGDFEITLTDADGNSVEITTAMWDADGNLKLAEGISGVITGPDQDTLTFTDVEIIRT
jgi:Ca2+-binding RTX toxin-like protein